MKSMLRAAATATMLLAACSLRAADVRSLPDCSGLSRAKTDRPADLVSLARQGASLKVGRAQAAREMDAILGSQYGVKVPIDAKASGVRARVADIAELTMNNQVIAAQMLSTSWMQEPDYALLPHARALNLMVLTATEPYEGDKELADISVAHTAERARLGGIYGRTVYVRWALLASAFGDDVALDAAIRGICGSGKYSKGELQTVKSAVERVKVKR